MFPPGTALAEIAPQETACPEPPAATPSDAFHRTTAETVAVPGTTASSYQSSILEIAASSVAAAMSTIVTSSVQTLWLHTPSVASIHQKYQLQEE